MIIYYNIKDILIVFVSIILNVFQYFFFYRYNIFSFKDIKFIHL